MKIFSIQDGNIVLEREEVALVKEFNNLLRRVIPCEGDPKGNLKLRAFQEFNYIYQVLDYNSFPNKRGLTEEDAHLWAINNAGLPNDWIADPIVLKAMEKYEELIQSPSRDLCRELLITLNNSYRIVRKIRDMIDLKLKSNEITNEDLDILISYQNKLLAIADKLPNTITTLKEVEKLIEYEEDNSKQIARGGDEVLDSMNPDTSL